jgi:hypothetical protein
VLEFSAFSCAALSCFSCAALSFDFGVALGDAVAATVVAVTPVDELGELVAAVADPPESASPPMNPPVASVLANRKRNEPFCGALLWSSPSRDRGVYVFKPDLVPATWQEPVIGIVIALNPALDMGR